MSNPFDDTSKFDTIFLSTRLTREEHEMLNEIQGWYQTVDTTRTIRKQETIRRIIREGYAELKTQIANMDLNSTESQTGNVIRLDSKEGKDIVQIYREISNKDTYRPPTKTETQTTHLIQKNLGL